MWLVKQYIADIPAIARSHSSSWGYLDTPWIATGKLFSQDQAWFVVGKWWFISENSNIHTVAIFLGEKTLLFLQTEPHSGARCRSWNPRSWRNASRRDQWWPLELQLVYGSTSRTSYWSMGRFFVPSLFFNLSGTRHLFLAKRPGRRGQPWDFNPHDSRHQ